MSQFVKPRCRTFLPGLMLGAMLITGAQAASTEKRTSEIGVTSDIRTRPGLCYEGLSKRPCLNVRSEVVRISWTAI